jgi:5-methylcytosine-specific restriction endonuclease McrA
MVKECVICDKEFEGGPSNKMCCSPECSKIKKNNYAINFMSSYRKTKEYAETVKNYRQTDKNKKYRSEYSNTPQYKAYAIKYRSTPEFKQYKKDYINTDKYKEYMRQYYRSYKYKSTRKAWNKTNNGKFNSIKCWLNRRAHKNNIIEIFNVKQLQRLVLSCNGLCPNCNKPFNKKENKITYDHIYPVSQASKDFISTGEKRIYNITDMQILCSSCNSEKGTKLDWKKT